VKVLVTGDNVPEAVVDGRRGMVIEANIGSVSSVNGQHGAVNLTGVTGWTNATIAPYNADNTGTTDAADAIQAAIDNSPPGCTVYLPAGVYALSKTLDLRNGVSLRSDRASMMVGPGMTGTEYPCFLQPTADFDGAAVIQIIGDADGDHPLISGEQHLTNLMIDGSKLGGSVDGLYARGNVQNVVLDNVTIRQMTNNGIVTASRTDGTFPFSWRLHHVMIDQCHANGLLLTGNTDLTLADVQAIGCWAQGFILTNCTNAQLTGCRAEWNGSHGYHITGNWGDWAGSGGMQITGCSTDRNGQHGILIDATGNTPIVLSGIQLRRDGANGGLGGGGFAGLAILDATVPVTIDGITCYPGVDDGGTSSNSPQYGVRLSGAATVLLDDAILHADTAGLDDDGTNTLVNYGPNIVTIAGPTTSTTRVLNPSSGSGGGGSSQGIAGGRYVAASDATTAQKARADYVCDGTADNVQIQDAIDAVKAEGGGIVQLSGGTFTLADTLTITGNTDEDNADTLTLRGAGAQATTLTMAADTNGIELTDWAMANIEDLGIVVSGSGSGIHSTAVLSGNEVSFWHSSFRNLRLNGGFTTTNTGWGMDLAMPWRSVFENIEIEGTRNGMRLSNQGDVQNAGDCTFTRMFIEIVGTGGVAIHVSSPSNNMNQNNFNMVEIGANGTGCTGILIDGAAGGASQRFWGLNAEQFQTTINVANGESNVFDCNYITCDTGQAGNKMFVCGTDSYNNVFSAKWVNVAGSDSLKIIEDNNTTSNCPNVFEKIRIENNSGATVTYSKTSSTVLRDITTFNTGNTMPAGLLQYPLSTVNDPTFTPADHGLITWTQDPATLGADVDTTATGTIYLMKVKIVNRATVVTNVHIAIGTAGTGLTSGQNLVGLYDSSGTRLAVSADQTTAYGTAGLKTIPLTAAQTLAVGSYYIAFLSNGSTPPKLLRGHSFSASGLNANLTTGAARFLNTANGQTTLPASITLSAQSTQAVARWAGLS
jgi:hypothetical protein